MAEIRILALTIDDKAIRALDDRTRNQMFGCMHAHNELAALNRLFMFSMNEIGSGELHDSAYFLQMWCLLQLLAGKLFETWKMLNASVIGGKKGDDVILQGLIDEHKASLEWLKNYFGQKNYKPNPLKSLRDTTGFHYSGLDFGESLKHLAKGKNDVFLAQHPNNFLYWVGSALVFRSAYTKIADAAESTVGLNHGERVRKGFEIVVRDAAVALRHMHQLLNGLISAQIQRALGGKMEPPKVLSVQAAAPEEVKLPTFVDMGSPEISPPLPVVVLRKRSDGGKKEPLSG